MATNATPSLTLNPLSPPSPACSSSSLFLLHDSCIRKPSSLWRRSRDQKLLSVSLDIQITKKVVPIQCSSNGNYISNHFRDIGFLFSLFQDIGIEEEEIQVLLEKNPSLKSSSLESLRSRILSLQSVGIDGFALCRSIAKCPEILTALEIEPFLRFISDDLEGDIEPEKLERFLTSAEPSLLLGFAGKVKLLIDHEIPQDKIVHVLNHVSLIKVFGYKSVQEIERSIIYLKRFGGIELIVRRPALLNIDLDSQLIPRIRVLLELSGDDEDGIGVILRRLPAVLTYRAEHLQNHISFMKTFTGLNDEQVFRIITVYPNIFSASKERKLRPRIDFLKQCGFNSDDIFKFLVKAPLFLSLSFEGNLSKKLVFLVKLGYENETKDLAMALGAVCRTSCENLQKVIGIYLEFGLASEDILFMSKKHPQILQYNHKSLEKKMEYLVEGMGRDVGELLAFPAFLGYKLDDRIIHRYEVRKKIIGEGMSLNKLLSVSTERFSKKKGSLDVVQS